MNPVSRPGDLWLLGDHRLLCGDSTKADDVIRVMHNQKAILFATDPPYLVDYDGTNHPSKQGDPDKNKDWGKSYGITWDDSSQGPELYEGFIKAAIEHAILPNAAWYCWHASRRQAMVESVWEKFGAFVHQQIVWAKDRGILTRSYYLWQHEPCFFGWLKGNKPPRVSDDYPSTIWNIPTVKVGEKTEHPTSKPIEVFALPMRQHTKPGEVCFEPFSGSGSQIIAGETTGRRVFAIEISPQYIDVAVKRWQTVTGKHGDARRRRPHVRRDRRRAAAKGCLMVLRSGVQGEAPGGVHVPETRVRVPPPRPSPKQSRRMSLIEAIANVAVGFGVAVTTQVAGVPYVRPGGVVVAEPGDRLHLHGRVDRKIIRPAPAFRSDANDCRTAMNAAPSCGGRC